MVEKNLTFAIIVASIREGRFGGTVARWFTGQVETRGAVRVDVVDLRDFQIPVVQQSLPVPTGVYTSPEVRAFAERVRRADAFVVVTPEYNHGYPASLKLAVDSVNPEWRAKPVAFVSYGGYAGGLRAVEQLRLVFAELHAVTIRETVSFHMAHGQFDEQGEPKDLAGVNAAAKTLLDQLTWWAEVLRDARASKPYVT